ncbi:helix-turn-helix domain-containing protein [Nocardia sp. NPDC051030]|uniref:helix-turn-helix domain-containing protein n=1 Tax=Nocardia sp. NPDC051030 TaxID=3155162 RepID=UPI003438C7B3
MLHGVLTLPLPTLGDFVRFHRERLGLTREELAARTFVSTNYLKNFENGSREKVGESTLDALHAALELTTEEGRRHLGDLSRVHARRPWMAHVLRNELDNVERELLSNIVQPAAYCNERWDVVEANAAYLKYFPGRDRIPNVILWTFSEYGRTTLVDWENEAVGQVSRMRATMAHFGNPDFGRQLLFELQDDPDFSRMWLTRDLHFNRPVAAPVHLYTDEGPISLTMHVRPMPDGADLLHLCVGNARPYSGPGDLLRS